MTRDLFPVPNWEFGVVAVAGAVGATSAGRSRAIATAANHCFLVGRGGAGTGGKSKRKTEGQKGEEGAHGHIIRD